MWNKLSAVLAVLLAVIVALPLQMGTHVFDENVLKEIARDAIHHGGLNSTKIVQMVVTGLRHRYPKYIIEHEPKWVSPPPHGKKAPRTQIAETQCCSADFQ